MDQRYILAGQRRNRNGCFGNEDDYLSKVDVECTLKKGRSMVWLMKKRPVIARLIIPSQVILSSDQYITSKS